MCSTAHEPNYDKVESMEHTSAFSTARCQRCSRKLIHPPIKIPNCRPAPRVDIVGKYEVVDELNVCYHCAREICMEGGEFEERVLNEELEPSEAWVTGTDDNGRTFLGIAKINKQEDNVV